MKKVYRRFFAFLFATSSFMWIFSGSYCTQSPNNGPTQNRFEPSRQDSPNILNIDFWVFLSGSYQLIDMSIHDEIIVNVTATLTTPPTVPYDIYFFNIPFSLEYPIPEKNLDPSNANATYGFWGSPPTGFLKVRLPGNASYFSIRLEGHQYGKSVFWRNSAEIAPLNISTSEPFVTLKSYRLLLVPPSSSKILKVYSRSYPDLHYTKDNVNGYSCVAVTIPAPFIVLYESETWEVYAFLAMFITILAVFVVPYALRSKKTRAMTSRLAIAFTSRVQRLIRKPIVLLRWLYHQLLRLDSSKLLIAYFLCGLLMISTSFVAGPDPRLKVYVFASNQETANGISDFVEAHGGVTVTTLDELGDLRTMANLGVFSAAIIGDFFPPPEREATLKIYPALDNIPYIIILNVTGWQAHEAFSSEIEKRYDYKKTVVNDFPAFEAALRRVEGRENALGLDVTPNIYLGVSAFVGLCSFILVFLGLAFVASKLIEIGKKPGVRGFPEAIAYTILYFTFTQITYIVCSVLLSMPLGLHTSRLEAKVTAVSLLGFGGGGRPRMLAGLAGFLLGGFISLKEGLKLDKAGFMSLLVAGFFIIVDPLTSGLIFHEFILLYTVGPYFESAVATQSYVKTFLAEIGIALGGWASPTYGLSTGIILYCAGAIPACLFAKLERSTATVLLFFCAFLAASGGVRVADMNPWSAASSLVPGVVAGFIFAALFSLISLSERVIRKKIGRTGSD